MFSTGTVTTMSDLQRCSSEQAASQKFPGLNGHRRELPLPLQDVADGIDVRNVGLLLVVHWDLPVPGRRIRKGLNVSIGGATKSHGLMVSTRRVRDWVTRCPVRVTIRCQLT